MNVTESKNENIIDVINEFDYSTQQDEYNQRFIAWRRNKNNPYAYNFTSNKKESIFVDGQGFVSRSAAESEYNVLYKILYVIGVAMLIGIFIEDVFGKMIVQLLDMMGVDIHNSFSTLSIYGGKTEIVTILICIAILKPLIPILILHGRFRMPMKLAFPVASTNHNGFMETIASALLVSVITGIPAVYSNTKSQVYTYFKSIATDVSIWGLKEFIAYMLVDVVIVSILTEILFRGEMFTALRQFGDVFAVILTSVLSALVSQNPHSMAATLLISLVCSIGMLRTGSILTSLAARMTYKIYLVSITIIQGSSLENMPILRNTFMICAFLIGLVILCVCKIRNNGKEERYFANCTSHMSLTQRMIIPFRVLPFLATVLATITAAILNIIT